MVKSYNQQIYPLNIMTEILFMLVFSGLLVSLSLCFCYFLLFKSFFLSSAWCKQDQCVDVHVLTWRASGFFITTSS